MSTGRTIGMGGLVGALALCAAGAAADDHVNAERIEAAFAAADANDDGIVNVDEFVGYVVREFHARESEIDGMLVRGDVANLTDARYGEIDRDGDGRLSLGEVVGDAMIVFFGADASNDGVLTLTEILAFEAAR